MEADRRDKSRCRCEAGRFHNGRQVFRSRRINSPVGLLTDHEPVIGDEMRSVQVLSLAVSNQPLLAHLRNKDVVRDISLGSFRHPH
jgi:hypothetical protein